MQIDKKTPIATLSKQLDGFLHLEAASGIVLLLFTLIALIWANSSFSESYFALLHLKISFSVGSLGFETTLLHVVNDAVMCIFFFIIGLELKREFVEGELKNPKEAMLPIIAAIGGMITPAILFLLFSEESSRHGWAIPAATDIAFAVGVMALLSNKVPASLKVFLLTLAVADDIGAIIIIALFYSHGFDALSFMACIVSLAIMVGAYKIGVRNLLIFFLIALFSWYFLLSSGIHSTLLGVILGLMAPSHPELSTAEFSSWASKLNSKISELLNANDNHIKTSALQKISQKSYDSMSMLQRLELYFHPWNIFYVLPLFALFNAGFVFDASALASPLAFGIIAGLFIGKPLGILLFCYLAKLLGIIKIDFSFTQMLGVGFLAGIGFTMSIFISALAFDSQVMNEAAKGAIFVASLLAGIMGYLILRFLAYKPQIIIKEYNAK